MIGGTCRRRDRGRSVFAGLLLIPQFGQLADDSRLVFDGIAAVSVGISIFFMVLTNTEHPPAAGTILGLVVGGWTLPAVIFILTGVAILSIVHVLLKPRLVNLLSSTKCGIYRSFLIFAGLGIGRTGGGRSCTARIDLKLLLDSGER